MTSSSNHAAGFNRRLLELADRLAVSDIVTARLHADWGTFGSWELWLEAGSACDLYGQTILKGSRYPVPAPAVVRYSWDGRDRVLSVAVSTPPRYEAPSDWVVKLTRGFADMEEAIQFVEEQAVNSLKPGS
jgi:hypothetical protein